MKRNCIFIAIAVAILTAGCKGGIVKPNCSGAAFDLLWIINDDIYFSSAGDSMELCLSGAVPFLPQPEPQFNVIRMNHAMYDNLLQTTRNILFVNVDPDRYTCVKIKMAKDVWAKGQAICVINAPAVDSLRDAVSRYGEGIVDYFVKAERERMMNYYISNINREALSRTNEMFGYDIAVPTSINRFKKGENFLWMANGNPDEGQYVMIYTEPYVSKQQLTDEAILNRRDSVTKANIPGSLEGSYMTTERHHLYPESRNIELNGQWAKETRGLWKMNGDCMGGPFVSITTIDTTTNNIVTVEGFVYAPSKDKRRYLRQMDAMVYSIKKHNDNI